MAQAILEAAEEEGLDLLPVSHFEAMVGRGLSAQVEGRQLLVGNESLMKEKSIDSSAFQEQLLELSQDGKTAMFVAVDGQLAGILAVADEMKSSSLSAVQELQSMGLEVIMLTGDREETATAIARSRHPKSHRRCIGQMGRPLLSRTYRKLGKNWLWSETVSMMLQLWSKQMLE